MRVFFYKKLFIEVREEWKELSLPGKIAVPFFVLGGLVALTGFAIMFSNFLVAGPLIASFVGVGLFVGGAVLLGLAKPLAGKIAQFVEYIKGTNKESNNQSQRPNTTRDMFNPIEGLKPIEKPQPKVYYDSIFTPVVENSDKKVELKQQIFKID